MSEKILPKTFEQIDTYEIETNLAQTTLSLGRIAMQFSDVERTPRYHDGERESDVEHSYMLALVAPELARTLELPLDTGLISQFAIVHDLVELKTSDVATFLLDEEAIAKKEQREADALQELICELPPHTGHLLARYEAQQEPESRFVRLVDKLLPVVVDILGQGKRVMKEDYNLSEKTEVEMVEMVAQQRLRRKFGEEAFELLNVRAELAKIFASQYDDML